MSTAKTSSVELSTALRAIFCLVAMATLFENRPWAQVDMLTGATAYAGTLMWGAMAAFGNRNGWQRRLTFALALVYLVLVVVKIAGFRA